MIKTFGFSAERRTGVVAALVGAALVAWACTGVAQQPDRVREGSAEKAGEKIDDALSGLKRGVRDASESLRDRFARARTAVNDMGVEARLYGRLHWDKDLTDSAIELEVRSDGVATLRGSVPDASAKSKAVTLARETVGVSQVVDQLTVSRPARTTGAAPEARP